MWKESAKKAQRAQYLSIYIGISDELSDHICELETQYGVYIVRCADRQSVPGESGVPVVREHLPAGFKHSLPEFITRK